MQQNSQIGQNRENFAFSVQKGHQLESVHHRRLWRLWQISDMIIVWHFKDNLWPLFLFVENDVGPYSCPVGRMWPFFHLSPLYGMESSMFIKKKLFTALALQGAGAITLLAIRTVIKFNHPAVIRKAILWLCKRGHYQIFTFLKNVNGKMWYQLLLNNL